MTTIHHQLVQSRRGGKIHFPSCGARSLHVAGVQGTEKMTREEIVAKYGQALCFTCFPEADTTAPTLAQEEPKAEEGICPGSGTYDWATGKREPERWGYYKGNGGTCAHCNNWVATATGYNPMIRKHKA